MAPISIFRRPGVQHYQLVHRSLRDPLINDPDASARVLKSVEHPNRAKGKGRAGFDAEITSAAAEKNIGEAADYGVFFDDTEYNYMQHLRPVGGEEGDPTAEGFLIEAPSTKYKNASTSKSNAKRDPYDFLKPTTERTSASAPSGSKSFALPDEALPSIDEIPYNQAHSRLTMNVPAELQGLQPDMDPHLRQVLEALDDEAFIATEEEEEAVEAGDGDDWLDELLHTGEAVDPEEREEYEFEEWGLDEKSARAAASLPSSSSIAQEDESDWQSKFKAFKQAQQSAPRSIDSDEDEDEDDRGSEGRDTVSGLPPLSVIGGKRRRKGAASDATGFSMSSSSMFRNKGLSVLDEQFDQIEKMYEEDSSDDDDPSDQEYDSDGEPIDAPELVTREDFDTLIDDFLDNFEIVGNKLKPVMEGDGPMGKLATLRGGAMDDVPEGDGEGAGKGLGKKRILEANRIDEEHGWGESDEEKLPMPSIIGEDQRGWDCETILSTYTTLDNHPRLIQEKSKLRIAIDPKTGFPVVNGEQQTTRRRKGRNGRFEKEPVQDIEEEEEEGGDETTIRRETVTRPKVESKEEKKARKAAVKEERSARRVQKKTTKNLFSQERAAQVNIQSSKVAGGKSADLNIAAAGGATGILRLN
ncbi:Uncharacterized conserved protein [Phaffia rhodozyma]|uniref:Uncharacterized conserved protein n=1 Tax=Phaffia rhodozyma TaxID=264483 RepID=A0A0F7SH21_PHARH|nr:Uncharacterized conserved protein [Phaffia rhodozyma]